MLAGVLTKTVRDRWVAFVVGSVAIGLFTVFGMAVYSGIDLSFYAGLPEPLLGLMGISDVTDLSGLSYGAIFSFMGAMTLAGLAVWVGAGVVAGEERNGTISLLLGNPKSRTHVLLASAGALVLLTALGALIMLAGGLLSPVILDVDIGGRDIGALTFHLFANALFYGFIALAIGAWTGNGGLATGVAAAVMVVSYIAVGLLPLFKGLEDVARVFPWYYFDGSDPQFNGIDWGHIGVLAAGSGILAGLAVIGWNRRDLRGRSTGRTMVDRLRSSPITRRIVDRLAGSAAVSHVWTRTISEHQALLVVTAYIMALVGIFYGPLYSLLPAEVLGMADQLPKELLALVGNADMSTPEGFYTIEGFGLVVPIAMILVTVTVGSRALAGEEGNRTMGLLLANPVKRSSVVVEKTVALVIIAAVLGLVAFGATVLGSYLGGLGMDAGHIAAICLLAVLLGLVVGGLALLLSAATGRVRWAVEGSMGFALIAWLFNAYLPLNDSVARFAELSPFYYYLGNDPLVNGIHWGHAALLAALFLTTAALSVVLFERRDLRQTS